jgi:hypothetical protein
MNIQHSLIQNIPCLLYGEKTDKIFIYVHGRYSSKEEANFFADILVPKGYQVLSFDLPEHGERKKDSYICSIQNAISDLNLIYSAVKDKYKLLSLYGCSLGAYFSLVAFKNVSFNKCMFISPVIDMKKLIENMMIWANVTERQLQEKKEISTSFGETLSWDYYNFVKNNPVIKWNTPTSILYGENDNLTDVTTINEFANRFCCKVKVMRNGEHYFHTPEQLEYVKSWIKEQDYE